MSRERIMKENTTEQPESKAEDQARTVVMETADRTVMLETVAARGQASEKSRRTTSFITTVMNIFNPDPDQDLMLEQDPDLKAEDVQAGDGEEAENLTDLEDHFTSMKELASGGQGVLSQNIDRSLKRRVAVKSLRKELRGNPDQRQHFLAEARVTAQLEHPAIVPIHSLHKQADNGLAVTMKLIRGKSLQDYLKEITALYKAHGFRSAAERKALRFRLDTFLSICDALEYAHSRNVMHCDLKPGNIMVGEYHEAYLMDWGISHPIRSKEYDPQTWKKKSKVAGTPGFLSPETARGEYCDQRADICSMGLILFEIVTLNEALTGKTTEEIVQRACEGDINPIEHKFGFPVPADLAAIIRKATAWNPAERYQTMKMFSSDLRRFLRNEEVIANPDNAVRKLYRSCIQHHGKALVITALTA